ncbi:MAK10-like protein [Tanacetum coccineum]
MEAHLTPTQPTQVNKVTTSCEICSGPYDTQYCMEDPEQALVEYASSRTDEAGGLVSNFMASQDARLSKFEADFKQQQSEMINKIDTVLKAIIDQIAGALPSDTVKNPKLSGPLVLSACSYPSMNPQCSNHVQGSIKAITIHSEKQSDSYDEKAKENEEEEKDNPKNIHVNPSTPPDPSISFITEKVLKFNSFFESPGLVPQSSNTEERSTTTEEVGVEYFDIFPTRSELAYHKYLMCSLISSIFLRNPIITEGCPSNLKIPCNIRHVHVKKAYIDPSSSLNIMTRMMYNWIMRRKLDPKENSNKRVSNFTGRFKGMHVFVGNFTYIVDFMIVEDISSIIDPSLSQVVLRKPFVEIYNMTHDSPEGVVRFINGTDEIAYKMPHIIEQYNSLSHLEKEHTKSVYLRNEEDKRRGVEYVMSKILGFYKECLELGPEYVTGMDNEREITYVNRKPWCIAGDMNVILQPNEQSCGPSIMSADMMDFQDSSGIMTGALKKLDRIMFNEGFIKDFPQAHAKFLPYDISDHTLLFYVFHLMISGVKIYMVIKCINGEKLKRLKVPLKRLEWSKWNLFKRVECLRKQLQDIQISIDADPYDQVLKGRNNKSKVFSLSDNYGNSYDYDQIRQLFLKHFENFLGSTYPLQEIESSETLFKEKLSTVDATKMISDKSDSELKELYLTLRIQKPMVLMVSLQLSLSKLGVYVGA